MKISIKKQIGNSEIIFQIDKDKDKEALSMAGFLSETPTICSICKSKNISLSANKADGYTFIKVKCECGATAQMGEYKDGGFFWKKFEIYQKKDNQQIDNRYYEINNRYYDREMIEKDRQNNPTYENQELEESLPF